MNHLHLMFVLKDGGLTWTEDACQCFEEDERPVAKAELDQFGVERGILAANWKPSAGIGVRRRKPRRWPKK